MNGKEIKTLLQALPYIRQHKGATFVIKCGGEIARDAAAIDHLATDIALCEHVGIRPVVVHGGGPQASDLSKRLGVEPKIVQGRRITDDATLEVAKMVYGGKINIDILAALRRVLRHCTSLSRPPGPARRAGVAIMVHPSEAMR